MSDNKPSKIKRVVVGALLVGFLGVLCSLGTWQFGKFLDRWEIDEQILEAAQKEPLTASSASALASPETDYQQVRLVGAFEPEHSVLMERRYLRNQPGYWVVTPFRFADGSAVLVNRGWVSMHEGPKKAAEAALPDPASMVGVVNAVWNNARDVRGRAAAKDGKIVFGDDLPVILSMDMDLIQESAGGPFPERHVMVVLGDTFARTWGDAWPRPSNELLTIAYLDAERHMVYAGMWFGMALLALCIAIAAMMGKLDPGARSRSED